MSHRDSRAVPLAAALIILAGGCGGESDVVEPPVEALASLELSLPSSVTVGEPFALSVIAVGNQGTRPFTALGGQITLDLGGGAGAIAPTALSVAGGQASTSAAVITGTSGTVTVRARSGAVTGTGTTTAEEIVLQMADTLPGNPTAPATTAIPELEYEARDEDFSDDHPELPGLFVSWNTLMLSFGIDVTVVQANVILVGINATIVGGLPGIVGAVEGILTVRVPTTSHLEMSELVEQLSQNPLVSTVVPDVLLDIDVVPGTNLAGGAAGWTWTLPPAGGNWGLEAIRAPQMWNLNDYVARSGRRTVTGVFDVGFRTNHPDLVFASNQSPATQNYHGTHVAGTIGATFGNAVGIDGVNPFASLVVRAVGPAANAASLVDTRRSFGAAFLWGFAGLLRTRPDIRVVNISMGYEWGAIMLNPEGESAAQRIVVQQGRQFLSLLGVLASENPLPLIVVSSGNDSGTADRRDAFWSSPFVWAGYLTQGHPNIVVVESVQNSPGSTGGASRSSFSNVNGHLSAPGSGIVSTTMPRTTKDGVVLTSDYETLNGTSMATPHVTGLAGYLMALEPALTPTGVKQLLIQTALPVSGTSGRIDAFAAAMGIDVTLGNRVLQRALVDVDDGTADGNLRLRTFTDDPDPNALHGSGGRRGDGAVDMSDFRAFRDAFLEADQVAGSQSPISLDGPGTHFKRDLNEDGCARGTPSSPPHPNIASSVNCAMAPVEEIYSRFNFNGSGRLDLTAGMIQGAAVAPFKIASNTVCVAVDQPVGCLRDIDVLIPVWGLDAENVRADATDDAGVCTPPQQSNPPAGWTGTGLLMDRDLDNEIDYVRSTDLHIKADAPDDDAGLVIRSGPGGAFLFSKCRRTAYQGLLTVPRFDQPTVQVDYSRTMPVGPTVEERRVELVMRPQDGEDLGLEIGYDKLDVFSTTRQRASDLFDRPSQLEWQIRDVGPNETGYFALAEAGDQNALAMAMFNLAVQHVLPNSLVAGWLGSAEVVVPVWTEKCLVALIVGCEKWEGRLWGASMRGAN
ncbi:MAG: S8 family serine peptidase [Gemmatimonadetes bacterium]|nr:S8 family serine peptidase [Gemmatimonadota bacterium]